MSAPAIRFAKRWLYIGHRWLGIATCLLCAMWFVSGIVMMYVPYPRLTEHDRLAYAQAIDPQRIAISPDAAMQAAGLAHFPGQLRVSMMRDEPVYRIVDGTIRRTVSARDGRLIADVDAVAALAIVRDAVPDAAQASVETFARDQWTVAQGFNPHRPMHKVNLSDTAGTELYVSSRTGEIVQGTTGRERFWNWLGAVPHWLYPTVLRQDGEAWRQVVLWTSGPATIGAIAGLWIGILRLRVRQRYKSERMTPYRGWAKWHHVAGIVAGLFLTTWLWSGWLSVNPFRWFDRTQTTPAQVRAYAGQDAPVFPGDTKGLRAISAPGARDWRLLWFDGAPVVVAIDEALRQRVFDARTGAPTSLSDEAIARAARRLLPEAPFGSATRLTTEDDYWYSHHTDRKLPVLRITFLDAAQTWFHVDPESGEILGRSDASARRYRWLFNALHDFDLAFLLQHRPAWDIVVWLLSLGGMIVSVSGIVIGWRRLGRKLAH